MSTVYRHHNEHLPTFLIYLQLAVFFGRFNAQYGKMGDVGFQQFIFDKNVNGAYWPKTFKMANEIQKYKYISTFCKIRFPTFIISHK